MSDTIRRAVTYVRVSTEDQAENGTSLDGQEQACLRKAAELGAVVVATYRDEGVSGGLYLTRGGVQAALDTIERGRADTLIVAKLDRLGRDVDAVRDVARRVEAVGGSIVCCDGLRMENTAVGNLTTTMFAGFAEFERKLIVERTSAGSRRMAEAGVQPVRSRAPFGYRIITQADAIRGDFPQQAVGTYIVQEPGASIVRSLFTDYAGGAVSLFGLTQRLNERGVPTSQGAAVWTPPAVRCILRNPIYKGSATYGATRGHVDERRAERGLKPHYRTQRSDPLVRIAAPALVSEATWQTVQERMAQNRSRQGGNPGKSYMLGGLGRCPVCGRGLIGNTLDRGRRRYRCNRDYQTRHAPVEHYDAVRLDDLVLHCVDEAARQRDVLRTAFASYEEALRADRPAQDTDALKRELADLQRREQIAARAQVEALMNGRSPEAYEAILKECSERRLTLQAHIDEAERAVYTAPGDTSEECVTLSAVLDDLRRALSGKNITTAERRAMLQTIIDTVVPDGHEAVRVYLRPTGTLKQAWICFAHPKQSLVTDPHGDVHADLTTDEPGVLVTDLDLRKLPTVMFEARRPELYAAIAWRGHEARQQQVRAG